MRWSGIASVGGGTLAWWLVARHVGPLLLPTPDAVLRVAFTEHERLLEASGNTALAALGGLGAASVLALGAAIAAWWSAPLRLALTPYTVLVQVVPIAAIAPLLVVWLGYGLAVAASTAVIASFYPIYSAVSTGLVAPTQDLVDLFRLYGARRHQELWRLRLPAALPALFSGLRTAGGLAVIGAIVGEFVGSNGFPPTLGQIVVYSARSARLDLCFAAVGAAGLLALVSLTVIRFAERRAIGHWYGA